jgi:hypothetical protein
VQHCNDSSATLESVGCSCPNVQLFFGYFILPLFPTVFTVAYSLDFFSIAILEIDQPAALCTFQQKESPFFPSMALILPPGINNATFQNILDELSEIVGEANVSRDGLSGSLEGPHGQHTYGDAYVLQPANGREPSAAVRPRLVSEVQDIVRLANKYKFPLWTVSRGKNLG